VLFVGRGAGALAARSAASGPVLDPLSSAQGASAAYIVGAVRRTTHVVLTTRKCQLSSSIRGVSS
jgi:hypothetical protein